MKTRLLFSFMIYAALLAACEQKPEPEPQDSDLIKAFTSTRSDMFSVVAPEATEYHSIKLTSEQKQYVVRGNDFALRLLRLIRDDREGSFVFSPLSVQFALAMALNGADGETAREISDALGVGDDLESMNEYCRTMIEQLPAADPRTQIRLANAMLLNSGIDLSKSFKERVESNYYSPVVAYPFDDPTTVKSIVNGWFQQRTWGLCPGILNNLAPDASGYLLTGLGFKACWRVPFSERIPWPGQDLVQELPFHSPDGAKTLNFFYNGRTVMYADRQDYLVVPVPLGLSYVVYFIVPAEDKTVDDILPLMDGAEWANAYPWINTDLVTFKIPAFSTESSYALKDILAKAGLSNAFGGAAEFPYLAGEPGVFIRDVLHNAKLSFDEEGTEGAEPDESLRYYEPIVNHSEYPSPVEVIPNCITVDRPFVFLIQEYYTGAILFSGVFDGR